MRPGKAFSVSRAIPHPNTQLPLILMLVCPKCQCKNPIDHKFCQKCGISLTQKVCPECGTQVDVSALNCHKCGAKTGKTWWGIIVPKTQPVTSESEVQSENQSPEVATDRQFAIDQPISEESDAPDAAETQDVLNAFEQEENPQESEIVTATERSEEVAAQNEAESPIATEDTEYAEHPEEPMAGAAAIEASETMVETQSADVLTTQPPETTEPPETIAPAFTTGDYLDDRQRYQLIELMGEITGSGEWQGSVLDCQPWQISPLLTSFSASQSTPRSGSTTIIQSASMLPPAIAEPYLQLRSQWSPIVPLIHDAWEDRDYSILLIEERSALPKLIDHCQQIEALEASDFQQILQWFKQITELWQVLAPWNCRQSVLKIDNFLFDRATGGLRLQRLYADPTDSPSLAELGKVWQQLLQPTILSPEELSPEELSPEAEEADIETSSYPKLIQLVNDVANGKIATPYKLLVDIEAIAQPPEDEDLNEADDISTIMMTQGLRNLEAVGATDVGQQRSHNEDDFAIDTQISQRETSRLRSVRFRGLYIVCDGMGGHDGGEVASAEAVLTLQQYFATHWQDQLMLPDETSIREAVLSANQAIYNLNQEQVRSGSGRMGTTLVMALVNNDQIAVAHVGDSRLYRLTQSKGLEQITVDHEVGQREIQRGIDPEMAYSRPDAYQLTQALGPRPENFVQPDIQFLPIEEDSLFILASDGLTDNDLLENHVSTHLEPLLNSEADLKQGVQQLIALANDYNGHDNITAILIRAVVKH